MKNNHIVLTKLRRFKIHKFTEGFCDSNFERLESDDLYHFIFNPTQEKYDESIEYYLHGTHDGNGSSYPVQLTFEDLDE